MTPDEMSKDKRYVVRGWRGVAFRFCGWEQTHPDEFDWDYTADDTSRARMVMIGDDHVHVTDPYDCEEIPDEEFCHECGQIGCTADGRDAS